VKSHPEIWKGVLAKHMQWNKKPIESDKVREVAAHYSIDLLTASILVRRGILEPGELCFFLENDLRFLHNPFSFEEMEETADRILQAGIENEKVLVFGDRDVDGITSIVLMVEELRSREIETVWSLPSGDEPYGLSMKAVEEFAAQNGTLIITVDCGISNHKEIARGNELGIDTIIIDHHNPQDELPPAYAIVNPKMENTLYPFRDLCGCAVAAKVVWALRFAETRFYNQEVCLLNIRPGNEAYIIDAAKIKNMLVTDRVSETIIPGMVDLNHTRLADFLQGMEIIVYDSQLQENMLRRIFGKEVLISLTDLSEPIGKTYPSLRGKSLLRIREYSRMAKYQNSEQGELDTLLNLFTTWVLHKTKDVFQPFIDNLDLVALGTLADLMPLVDENRILVKKGMEGLQKTNRPGLNGLLMQQGLYGKKVSTTDIAWQISPLINATGRMGVPEKAVELLLSREEESCKDLSEEIVSLNKQRKKLGEETWERIRPAAQKSYEELGEKILLVGDSSIHRGITGILASRLAKYFNAPAVVVSFMDDKAVGSLRSNKNFKLPELLDFCAALFIDYGGHDFAAGFTMPFKKYDSFRFKLKEYVQRMKKVEEVEESITVDAELPLSYMTPELITMVEKFEPYGQQNPPLVFLIQNVRIQELELMGKSERQHVRMLIDTGNHKWPAVFWNASDRVGKDFALSDTVDILFRLGRNYFMNTETLQLTILDIRK